MRRLLAFSSALALMACAAETDTVETSTAPASEASVATDQSQGANALFEQVMSDHWASNLEQSPTFATSLGVREYDDRLSDPSLAAYDAGIETAKGFLARLEAIATNGLNEANALNYTLLKLQLENAIEAADFGGKYMIITNRGGPHMNLTRLPSQLPFFSKADYQSYVSRLAKIPEYLERATGRVRAGLEAGWVQPCEPMTGYEQSISTHIVDNVSESVFLQPFDNKPAQVSDQDFDALREQAAGIVAAQVIPAFRSLETFYLDEYQPACRAEVGTNTMPGGDAYYAHRARLFTTTDMTPDEIHEIGLQEVARIRAEMEEVIEEAGFDGNFAEWLEFLATTPDFYPKTGEERMQLAATISKRMDGELPKLFGHLPRMPYGLKEIPLDIAEKTTTAYYSQPAGDGTRAGFYFVNTTLLETRPNYQLEALSLHEAVPGHHLQIAIAQELEMPPFRRFSGFTAFVEGWGLYSERLGLEVGFYDTPYTNFGRLSYEMWRACRLVVDTGLHSKGWTRQQAIDYMAENSGLSMNNVTTEVDRYITWPGQALAYKIGELKIRELRAYAEAELGNDFDIRAFHDTVLGSGAIPLSVLEQVVQDWVADQKAG
ncbi:DUF885 family protein [Parvularcula sp. IMCC14364]|uniref:DUF885 domain-containing protein n=1 Tax=Parvularcula sp. IMCC14364 TaxID=3067902 RepID=UPI0027410644|nr:DUF885 domain-containing protein [Parvularcula sp. IMCC14364]